ncbi:unnamed protein product [Dovyalis caffra]|uniref:Uncharacterized protein n=1 Tax=Dovyalis caffra TaxID=77055 RepID=A0AAV1S0V9_9ROSI|nr:unnamed protein product [Dovyalis caffra]
MRLQLFEHPQRPQPRTNEGRSISGWNEQHRLWLEGFYGARVFVKGVTLIGLSSEWLLELVLWSGEGEWVGANGPIGVRLLRITAMIEHNFWRKGGQLSFGEERVDGDERLRLAVWLGFYEGRWHDRLDRNLRKKKGWNGTPQALATFLAPGDAIYSLRLGSLRYPQKQGCCSFSVLQQVVDGGAEDKIAPRHGLSIPGLHVTACDTCASAKNITTTTITKEDTFFIFNNLNGDAE